MTDLSEAVPEDHAKIFISYRRDDCAGHAGRLYDRLCDRFGEERIFMDIDSIEPGEDFVEVIDKTVGSCNVFLALIGQEWLTSSIDGQRRLDNPADFVRLEVGTALRRQIRVIPVLVQGATMPASKDLPPDLAKLVRRNALDVDDLHWRAGVERLIETIEKILAKPIPPPISNQPGPAPAAKRPPWPAPKARYLAAGLLVAVILGTLIYTQSGTKKDASEAPKTSLDAIRRGITIRAGRSAKPTDTLPDGRTRYLYSIWVEAPPETISRIARVLYHYDHPQFENQRKDSSDSSSGFRDSYNGIGAVNADMDVIIVLRDGREVPFKFNMFQAVFGPGATPSK